MLTVLAAAQHFASVVDEVEMLLSNHKRIFYCENWESIYDKISIVFPSIIIIIIYVRLRVLSQCEFEHE